MFFFAISEKKRNFANDLRQKKTAMSEKEIDQYRLTDLEEPTDEMLAFIMHEVAEEARRTNEEAHKLYFAQIRELYQQEYGNINGK